MDLSDLEGAVASCAWALKPSSGHCAIIMTHPFISGCHRRRFDAPPGEAFGAPPNAITREITPPPEPEAAYYAEALVFERSYFESRVVSQRWGSFESDFLLYHRPMSEYARVFRAKGFVMLDLKEPIMPKEAYREQGLVHKFIRNWMLPCPIGFLLRKEPDQ